MFEIINEIYTQTPLVFRIWILFVVWAIICLWKIFVKAWRKWWESLFPIWHIFILFKISKRVNPWFWILCAIPFISYWFYLLLVVFMFSLNRELMDGILLIIQILEYSLIALYAIMLYWLTLAFWKSKWFVLWLFFFWPIFFWILAFDKSKYILNE